MILTSEELQKFLKNNRNVAYCKILKIFGSSPRENGAWMLISNEGNIFGTIGGGQLEYNLIQNVMRQNWKVDFKLDIETSLGPDIAQCCGGKVIISIQKLNYMFSKNLLEKLKKDVSEFTQVLIFGAGNVGTSLALQMCNLPFKIKLIDNRENFISKIKLPIEKKFSLIPEQVIREANACSCYIITTHDHGLDFLLCYEILKRQDASYIGMIGSKTKRGTLKNWLRNKGINDMSNVNIPIGKSLFDTYDKRPEIISAHIISEILSVMEKKRFDNYTTR